VSGGRDVALVVVLLAGLCFPLNAAPLDESGINVRIDVAGDVVKTAASFYVDVSPRDAWAVITDYDHAADFLSGLESSRIESRQGNTVTVYQKGASRHGPFDFSFESVREVELTPFQKTQSHLISGSLRMLDTTTLIEPEGAGTRITDYRQSVPSVRAPLAIARPFMERETRKSFAELRREMLRRKDVRGLSPQ
jgi:hypothetical protein